MNFENIIFEKEDRAAWIKLNRPDKLNAFGGSMREDLFAALDEAERDESIRVIIITGVGKGFCAGGDIEYMSRLQETRDLDGIKKLLEAGRRAILKIRAIEKPVVAMINGPAAGAGLNLALACDIRIASENAKFSQAFAKIGLHPDWGGTYFLPRLVGTARACEMIFTGDMISSEEALKIGLVNRVTPLDQLEQTVRELAAKLAVRPPISIALAKRAIYQGIEKDLESMLVYETEAQTVCFGSEDAAEGIKAFLERREPNFTGK